MPNDSKPADGVHRLTNMVTEEVSLVDRAANRKRFYMVKRDNMAGIGAPVVAGANGQFTAQAAAPATAPAAAPAQAATHKGKATLLASVQEMLSSVVQEAIDTLTDVLGVVDGATVTEDPAEVAGVEDVLSVLLDVSESVEDSVYAAVPESEGSEPAAEAGATEEASPPPATKRYELLTAKRVIAKGVAASTFAALAKRGSKMKKERHSRFMQALTILQHLAAEVAPSVETEKGKKPAKTPAEPTGPTAANTPPAAMAPKGKTKKVDEPSSAVPAELAKRITEQAETIARLTAEVKKRDEAQAALRSAVAPSNVSSPESASPAAREFSWPLDMNALPSDDDSFNV